MQIWIAFLDVNKIIFGDNVMVGPRASFYTAGHPIDPTIRTAELEFGTPIIVEDNVWIGGSATILPGVTIGKMLLSLLVLWLQKTFLPTRLLGAIQQKSFAKLMKTISNFGQKSNGSIKSLRSNSFMNKNPQSNENNGLGIFILVFFIIIKHPMDAKLIF